MTKEDFEKFSVEYERILRESELCTIIADGAAKCSDGTTSYDRIWLNSSDFRLVVSVDINTDEIVVNIESCKDSPSSILERSEQFPQYYGKEFGWCWLAENYLGNNDGFLISFTGITPNILFLGEGGCLRVFNLAET